LLAWLVVEPLLLPWALVLACLLTSYPWFNHTTRFKESLTWVWSKLV